MGRHDKGWMASQSEPGEPIRAFLVVQISRVIMAAVICLNVVDGIAVTLTFCPVLGGGNCHQKVLPPYGFWQFDLPYVAVETSCRVRSSQSPAPPVHRSCSHDEQSHVLGGQPFDRIVQHPTRVAPASASPPASLAIRHGARRAMESSYFACVRVCSLMSLVALSAPSR